MRPMIRRLGVACLPALAGAALLMTVAQAIDSLWLQALVYGAMAMLLSGVTLTLLDLAYWFPLRIPYYARFPIVRATLWFTAAAFLLRHDAGPLFRYAAIGLAALSAFEMFKLAPPIGTATLSLHRLRRDYREGRLPTLRPPHLLVSTLGAQTKDAMNLVLGHAKQLRHVSFDWATRMRVVEEDLERLSAEYLKRHKHPTNPFAELALSVGFGFRYTPYMIWRHLLDVLVPGSLLTSRDLEHYPAGFREYVGRHAVATVTVVPLTGYLTRWLYQIDTESPAATELKAVIRDQFSWVPNWMRDLRPSWTRDSEQLQLEMLRTAHLASSTAVIVWPQTFGIPEDHDHDEQLIREGYEPSTSTLLGPTAPVTEKLGRTILPLVESDRLLGVNLRSASALLAREGLPPIADVYLRFRLSSSNVERFLCLMDGFEALIKLSVFASLVLNDDSPQRRRTLVERIPAASMGQWCNILREALIEYRSSSRTRFLSDYWDEPLAEQPRNLIDTVNGVGLAWQGSVPRTHLQWLDWLTWLRNTTRGHGSVKESVIAPVWHPLHEAYLAAVQALQELTIEAQFVTGLNSDEPSEPLYGWRRGPFRSSDLLHPNPGTSLSRTSTAVWQRVFLHSRGVNHPLDPFIWIRDRSCYVWNSMASREAAARDAQYTKVDCIDYATGRIARVDVELPAVTL
jgi:hypothetical protein